MGDVGKKSSSPEWLRMTKDIIACDVIVTALPVSSHMPALLTKKEAEEYGMTSKLLSLSIPVEIIQIAYL